MRAREDAIKTVCLLEDHFPTSILNVQVHLLVHLVDEVQLAGTVHARWMFFLERFMKTLKGFVRQKARPEGSMAEGWLVQESCVFISGYLTQKTNVPHLWSTKDDDRVVGEVPQGNGVRKLFDEVMRTRVNNYCMMNSKEMQKWYERYEEKREEQIEARDTWRRANNGVPFPNSLRLLPKVMSPSWLRAEMARAKANGQTISPNEEEFAFGPDWQVSQSFQYLYIAITMHYVLQDVKLTFLSCSTRCSIAGTMHYGHTEAIFEWRK